MQHTTPASPEDLWAWVHEEEPAEEPLLIDPDGVVAVMVVHNAREWLPRQLLSLARLSTRPGRIVAVDNGSTDGSVELLERAAAEGVIDEVVQGEAGLGFGEAVALGITGEPEWVWLLHDDSAPRPDALLQLLHGARATGAAVVVPKLLQPRRRNYPETLSEIGQSITRSGRRVDHVDVGDIDQLQETHRPVLGGSTAGMLVNGEVWRELGGLAPELPLFRDGVDLGWRATEAGHLVTTWPEAALTHRQAGRNEERESALAAHPHEVDRLAALRVAAARGDRPANPFGLVLLSWLRAVGFLLGKSPAMARAELRAARGFRRSPGATASLRARAVRGGGAVQGVLPGRWWGLRHGLDRVGNYFAESYRELTTTDADTSLDELTSDDAPVRERRGIRLPPVLVLVVGLVLAALLAGRTILGPGSLAGGGLLSAPGDLADAWAGYVTPQLGAAGGNAPWLGFGALGATLALGRPDWFAFAALLLAPLLAALAALSLLRRLGVTRGVASLLAWAWAAATLLLGLVTAGDISGMLLAVCLPMAARAAHRLATDQSQGAEALRAPASLAFWALLVGSAWPAALVLMTAAGLVWLVARPRRRVPVALAVVLPWLFLAPWLPTLVRWPGRVLTGADPMAWPSYPPAASAMLAGRILPSGLPLWANVTFFVVLGLASLYCMAQLDGREQLLAGAGIAAPLLLGVAASRIEVGVHGGSVRPLLSGWALLVVAAMLVPVVLALVRRDAERRLAVDLRVVTGSLAVVALLGVGVWGAVGFQGPVRSQPSALPGYVRDVVQSPRDARVLMVELADSRLLWDVVEQRQPQWGTGERPLVASFGDEFAGTVQALSSGNTPEDLAAQLTDLGVSHVWMRGFDEERLAAIGNAPGMTRAAAGEHTVVWTLVGLVSRSRVVEGREATPVVDGFIPAGPERVLRVAEEPDDRWQAHVGGTRLDAAPTQPPVSWTIPEGVSGKLRVGLGPNWGAVAWQGLVLLVLAALAAPTLSSAATARRGLE